jgi:nicotinamide-nucleotide amidase
MFTRELLIMASELIKICRDRKLTISTAESCTGGLIGACITSMPGSSKVFDSGFCTYSNNAKIRTLGISDSVILKYGAVSKEVAIAMCENAMKKSNVDLTVAVTGIAGPGGGTKQKPVGTVEIASAYTKKTTISRNFLFKGNRDEIRLLTVKEAIIMLLSQLK